MLQVINESRKMVNSDITEEDKHNDYGLKISSNVLVT